jgi:hypothetical protein
MSVVKDWLQLLHGRSPGYFAVTPFVGGKPRRTSWFNVDQIDTAARSIDRTKGKADIYVSVATHEQPSEKGRGSLATTVAIPGFWADIDIGTDGHKPANLPNPESQDQALSILDGIPPATAIVHSGGGLQVWWMFAEPWVFEDRADAQRTTNEWHQRLVQAGADKGYHVDSLGDLPRILRVPGTFNYKLAEARPVELWYLDGPTYRVEELAALGLPLDTRDLEEYTSDLHDEFPFSWEEILEPHGYTIAGPTGDGPGRYIIRPGKKRSEGHSGTIDNNGTPVLVNFSASDPLLPSGPGQRLTKLKVWAQLNHHGDLKAARKAINKLVGETPEQLSQIASRFGASLINFETLWTEEDSEPKWMLEPLIEYGKQIAIYSEAKTGKTLLSWDVTLGLATGAKEFWGQSLPQVRILYIDRENTRRDVREKFGKMGYEGELLPNLFYYSFPDLSFLDTEEGGQELYALSRHHAAELVFIDTLSRVVEGEENDNNTYQRFYKYSGVRLKADGITMVRLDHSGKDGAKGMRGASSKRDDVDEVWALTRADDKDNLLLNRTHSRSNHGADRILLIRKDTPKLHHEITNGGGVITADDVEVWLDLQGIPMDARQNVAEAAWREAGGRATTGFTQNQVRAGQAKRKKELNDARS